MSTLRERIATLRDRIDERHLRERILLLAAIVVVLLLIWDVAIRAPLAEREQAARDRISQIDSERSELRDTAESLRAELDEVEADPEADRIAALEAELEAVDAELTERTARVISPAEMVAVLRDMVAEEADLQLQNLSNLGVEEAIAEDRDEGIPRVYRHRVELVATGDFFAVLSYLRRLEGLDWQFQWDDLRLETVSHPRARVTISLSTLSLDEGWIGV